MHPCALAPRRSRCRAFFPRHLQKLTVVSSLLLGSGLAWSAVPNADITLQPVVSNNLPVVTAITAYTNTEASASAANRQAPLYAPYGDAAHLDPGWWDNLVSEQLQARLPVVMLTVGGQYTLNPGDLTGAMNANLLPNYFAALSRQKGLGTLKFACFAESNAESIYRNYYGLAAGAPVDFANSDCWNQIFWLRIVKNWCDNVPQSEWYLLGGKLPIEFWGLGISSLYINQQGNVSQMCAFVDAQLFATYGVHACFIMGDVNYDTTLATEPSVMGNNMWFSPPGTPYTMTTYKGKIWGGMVPGYIDPNYFLSTSPNYHNPNRILPRNGVGGTGVNGDTMKAALNAAVTNNSYFNVIEGWTNIGESTGSYRSTDTAWDGYPNRYINIIRSYTDLRTVTLRLEAEAADQYADTTSGNSGGSFLRAPADLDVRALTGASAITCSTENPPFQYAYQAFDGVLNTKWFSNHATPCWLQYDYGTGNSSVVTGYWLTTSDFGLTDAVNRAPKDWTLQGSNNGSTWTNLDPRTGETFTDRNQTKFYSFTNTTAYRYYRLNVTAVGGGGTNGVAFSELRFKTSSSNGGGWAVTNTAANEWLEFDGVTFSPGNYKFPIRYSTTTASRHVRLYIDGIALPDVTLPTTASMDTFDTISLGQKTLTAGVHTLKVFFVDGGVDLDWLFVKKYDPLLSLHASTGYISAELGGNSTMTAAKTAIGSWEKFSANDLNGGTLDANDAISLQVYDGLFLTATGGGGSSLTANQRTPGTNEQFTIVKVSGTGPIANGDSVALRSANGKYMTVVGSGTSVDVSGTTIGAAQTFTATLNTQ